MINKNSELYWRLFVYTRKQLLLAIGIFLATIAVVAFAIVPQINDIGTNNSKLTKEKAQLNKLTSKHQELEQIKLSPEFAQADKIDAILPSKKPLIELMSAINSVASVTQVAVSDLQINPGEIATTSAQLKLKARQGNSSYDRLELTATVVGQLNNIQQFLSLIEQISPITTITKISLNQTIQPTTGAVITTAQLTMQTNYFTQQIKTTLASDLPTISSKEKQIFQTIQGFTIPQPEGQVQVQGGGLDDPFAIQKIPTQ